MFTASEGNFPDLEMHLFLQVGKSLLPVVHMLVSCSVSSVPSMWYVYTLLLLKQFYQFKVL